MVKKRRRNPKSSMWMELRGLEISEEWPERVCLGMWSPPNDLGQKQAWRRFGVVDLSQNPIVELVKLWRRLDRAASSSSDATWSRHSDDATFDGLPNLELGLMGVWLGSGCWCETIRGVWVSLGWLMMDVMDLVDPNFDLWYGKYVVDPRTTKPITVPAWFDRTTVKHIVTNYYKPLGACPSGGWHHDSGSVRVDGVWFHTKPMA